MDFSPVLIQFSELSDFYNFLCEFSLRRLKKGCGGHIVHNVL